MIAIAKVGTEGYEKSLEEVEEAIEDHVNGKASLVGQLKQLECLIVIFVKNSENEGYYPRE